jgi:hypothetical protein
MIVKKPQTTPPDGWVRPEKIRTHPFHPSYPWFIFPPSPHQTHLSGEENAMKSVNPLIPSFLILLFLLLTSCATPPTTPGSGYVRPPDAAAQATLGARQAEDAAATYEAAMQATQVIVQSTEQARAQATATAVTAATGTALSATSTAADLSVRGTQIALIAIETGHAMAAAATGTQQAAFGQAEMTAQAIHMANAQMLQDAERQRLAAQQQRQELLNATIPYVMVVLALAVLVLTGLFAYLMIRSRNPILHVEHLGAKIAIVPTANGSYAPLPGLTIEQMGQRALPAPAPALAEAAPQHNRQASWAMFSQHRDPTTVPIGVNSDTGAPVFLNREHNPHLLIAGTTGAGKTTAGLAPFVAGSWRNQCHVIVINGRGSDFAPFADQPNITLWPTRRPLELLEPLAHFLTLLVEEMYRRDVVLARQGARSWSQLPPEARESGELLIAIDEFLTIVGAAQEAAELARLARDGEAAKALAYQATVLWLRLIALTNEGRKYGIYLAVTMTDPTRETIGSHGMRLRRQMATIGFRMNSPASSRAFLDVSGAEGLASGSAGLPNGRFVYNISGQVGTAVGFLPDRQALRHFLASHPVPVNPLPEPLARVVAQMGHAPYAPSPSIPVLPGHPQIPPSSGIYPMSSLTQAELDGQLLRPYLAEMRSLNAAGCLLSDVSGRPSGQLLRERLKPALLWLAEVEQNADAARLLERFTE